MLHIHQIKRLANIVNVCRFLGHALETFVNDCFSIQNPLKKHHRCNILSILVFLYVCLQPWTLLAQNDIVLKDPVFGNTSITAPGSITLTTGFTTVSGSVFTASIGPVQTTGGSTTISGSSPSVIPASGTTGQNFIKTITYRQALSSVPTGAFKNNEIIQYFDGLGRPIQTVSVGASPSGNDIILPEFYDNLGREANKALLYTATKSGDFRSGVSEKTLNTYYGTSSTSPLAVVDTSAYTKIGFENSPLNRVFTQNAPGVDWKSKPVTYNYLTNSSTDNKVGWTVTGDYTYSSFIYGASSLYITETIDEEGNTARLYKDKQDKVVLKESKLGSSWLRTAYIYDDFGLLRCVVPPAASGPNDQELCYNYLYDKRHRMIEKKIPGSGTIKLVYDQRDRLRCTQNNEQSLTHDWSYTKYDELNRPVISGVLRNYTLDITTAVTSGSISETRNNVQSTKGYTNVSFPGSTLTTEIHAVTFYDNYDFITPLGLSDSLTYAKYTDVYNYASKKDDTPIGRVTGMSTKVLPGETNTLIKTELYSTIYYDKYGHALRAISENHLGGKDVSSNNYEDITWLITQTRQEHYKGSEKIVIDKTMEYDHTGRLVATRQKVNTQDEITLNAMQYNEVGQLVTKYLHSALTTGTRSFLQKTDYQYNIRGWLTKINDPGLGSDNDLFGIQLNYNTTDGLGSLAPTKTLYNGNILAMRWNIKGDMQRGYSLTYDMLNRLTNAKYADGTSLANSTEYYSESVPAYDDNGNIIRLKRNYNNVLVDDLTYNYTTTTNTAKSNQVKQISDIGTSNANVDDYPGTSGAYTYDTNGNMHFDGSRNTTLLYNPTLNLPKYVDFGNNNLIYYSYTATGNKLVKHVQIGSSNIYTHYIGNVVYEDGMLSYITTEEGRLIAVGNGADRKFINEYELKDHLGNSRVAFMGTSLGGAIDVVQTTNYYPFGLVMNQTNTNTDPSYKKNKYLYNGKELQNDNLNGTFFGMLDYGARFYDPQIGRWHSVDPLAEKHFNLTPNNYCANNPIKLIDINGEDWFYFMAPGDSTAGWHWYHGSEHTVDYIDKNGEKGSITLTGQRAVIVFNGSREETPGTGNSLTADDAVTAQVTLYAPDGNSYNYTGYTMTSNADALTPIDEGVYNVSDLGDRIQRSGINLRFSVNGGGQIPTMDCNPNANPDAGENSGLPIKTGVYVHNTLSDILGRLTSTGCLLILSSDFNSFSNHLGNLNGSNAMLLLNRTGSNHNPQLIGIQAASPFIIPIVPYIQSYQKL